jgi:hypothetical protein
MDRQTVEEYYSELSLKSIGGFGGFGWWRFIKNK